MEIGVDIVKIQRFEKLISDEKFLNKVYSNYEINYIKQKGANATSAMAGLYCAKEAVLKAIGIGINGGIKLNEISIIHNNSGKPYVELNDKIISYLSKYDLKEIKISISHDKDYAISQCIIF